MTAMTPIQRIARQAVADAQRDQPDHQPTILAMKYARDRSGSDLAEARDAVLWALEHPEATSLEIGSVVATKSAAYFKDGKNGGQPWQTTTGHVYLNRADDEEVDELIASGEATVLRVGSGS